MLSHELARRLLELPNLPVAVTSNVIGTTLMVLSVSEDKQCIPQCRCADCTGTTHVIDILMD